VQLFALQSQPGWNRFINNRGVAVTALVTGCRRERETDTISVRVGLGHDGSCAGLSPTGETR
jgi:hypothetical protein